MTCREFADFIAEYLTGELPAESRQQFEGRVEGENVAGSITRPGASGAVGRFTLTIAE